MRVFTGVGQLSRPLRSSIVTIGNFDGLHRGHQTLIQRLTALATGSGAPSVVVTFHPHPVQVLHPEKAMPRLFDQEDQRAQLEKMGVEYLIIEPFSREFSQLEPDQYLLDWVFRPLAPTHIIVGYDFTFGANRRGTIEFLQKLGASHGITVEVMAPVAVDGQLVSSSCIRRALSEGHVELAAQLLGRPFYVKGLVEKGAGRGRQIGVPTANLHLQSELVPAVGVYATWAWLAKKKFKAATNVGFNPTFVSPLAVKPQVEAHLLDFDQDIYGQEIRLEFIARLRGEEKFSSVQALQDQIQKDVQMTRRLLS